MYIYCKAPRTVRYNRRYANKVCDYYCYSLICFSTKRAQPLVQVYRLSIVSLY